MPWWVDGEVAVGWQGSPTASAAESVDFREVPAVPTSLAISRGRFWRVFGTPHTKVAGWRPNLAHEPLRTGFLGEHVRRVYKKERQKRTETGKSMKVDRNRLLRSDA